MCMTHTPGQGDTDRTQHCPQHDVRHTAAVHPWHGCVSTPPADRTSQAKPVPASPEPNPPPPHHETVTSRGCLSVPPIRPSTHPSSHPQPAIDQLLITLGWMGCLAASPALCPALLALALLARLVVPRGLGLPALCASCSPPPPRQASRGHLRGAGGTQAGRRRAARRDGGVLLSCGLAGARLGGNSADCGCVAHGRCCSLYVALAARPMLAHCRRPMLAPCNCCCCCW